MRPFVHSPHPLTGHVSVDLCRSHIGVSEQLLNSSEICSSFEEMGGVRVAQRVGVQRAAVGQRMTVEHAANIPGGHPPAAGVEEEGLTRLGAGL